MAKTNELKSIHREQTQGKNYEACRTAHITKSIRTVKLNEIQ